MLSGKRERNQHRRTHELQQHAANQARVKHRLILGKFDTPPLRIGERFFIRQPSKLRTTRRMDRRYCVSFEVGNVGSAVWAGGVAPTEETREKVQLLLDRRFCPERRA
jgi:hypothetical protein